MAKIKGGFRPKTSGSKTAQNLPTLSAGHPFYLMYHPDRITVVNGQVVPLFATLTLKGGSNGIEDRVDPDAPNGIRYIDKDAQAKFKDDGWIILDDFDAAGEYLRPVQVKGGTAYITAFTKVHGRTGQTTRDDSAFVAWCRELWANEVIPPPSLVALRNELARYQLKLDRAADRALHSPSAKRRAEFLEQVVEGLEKAIAAYEDGEPTFKPSESDEVAKLKAELAASKEAEAEAKAAEAKAKAEAKAAKSAKTKAENAAKQAQKDAEAAQAKAAEKGGD